MTTTRKFFINNTITTAEDISKMVSDFKAFHFVNNERAEAIAEMTDIIAEYNETLKNTAIGTIATAENIVSALIPSITIDTEKAKNSNFRKRAVYNAVSYIQYRITEKDGKHEIKAIEKAVTVRDVFAYLCDLYASKHADRKITKADREDARLKITGGHLHAVRLFINGAYRFENITDTNNTFAIGKPLTEEEAKIFNEKPSKANAEKQIKYLAKDFGFADIPFRRIHALTLYKRAYTIDKFHQAKVCDVLDFIQDFIIATRYAKNNIELPDIKDNGGIFVVDETTKTADNVITF